MKTLNELNEEILDLEQQRMDLLNRQKLEEEQTIQDLRWTKDYKAKLQINTMYSAGLPKYKILVYGNPPATLRGVQVFGDHKLYEYNIMYGKDFAAACPCFCTQSAATLIQFLEEVEFLELEYDEEHLRVLEAVRERYDRT